MDAQMWSSPKAFARDDLSPGNRWGSQPGFSADTPVSPLGRRRVFAIACALGALAFASGEALLRMGDLAARLFS